MDILLKAPKVGRGTGKNVGVELLAMREVRVRRIVLAKKLAKGVLVLSTFETSSVHHFG